MKSKDTGGSVRKLRAALLWECFVIVVSRMHGLKNKSSTGKGHPKSNRSEMRMGSIVR